MHFLSDLPSGRLRLDKRRAGRVIGQNQPHQQRHWVPTSTRQRAHRLNRKVRFNVEPCRKCVWCFFHTAHPKTHNQAEPCAEAGQDRTDVLLQRLDTGSNGSIAITQRQHRLGQDYIWQAISGIRNSTPSEGCKQPSQAQSSVTHWRWSVRSSRQSPAVVQSYDP